jgi:superfamily II DNA or RNA helicase
MKNKTQPNNKTQINNISQSSNIDKPSNISQINETINNEVSSYINNRGYVIYKDALNDEEIKYIKEELTVRPYIPNSLVQAPSFPIYRESKNKFYLPRYFGFDNYGDPDENKLPVGDNISLNFNGNLRDYQETIVNTYLNVVLKNDFGGGGLLDIMTGMGKTTIALNIVSRLKKKTLVIVHKTFLLNQWVERINQYLPGARIGRIQGPVIDIDNKDIVIGMLQSLSMKEYPEETFKSFGLTIVDEVHHISSEVFSRSLLTVVTKYTLGLSATMQRKDGLTKVFKMYLGDIIYRLNDRGDHNVMVKAIEYNAPDTDYEYANVETDYRGNPLFSTMISKVCSYNRRSDYIINIIKKEFEIKNDQQMILLAHNRNLLTYLYDGLKFQGIDSVGYYVGGMKDKDLKASEKMKVILATYQMAAEGLDIPTLSTLILATPKTDIVQSVGRILRVKHERPLIIDIIDQHGIFKQQWSKRKAYYIKCKYNIVKCKKYNLIGSSIEDKWVEVYNPNSSIQKNTKTTKSTNTTKTKKSTNTTNKSVIDILINSTKKVNISNINNIIEDDILNDNYNNNDNNNDNDNVEIILDNRSSNSDSDSDNSDSDEDKYSKNNKKDKKCLIDINHLKLN